MRDGSPLDVPIMLFGWDKQRDMHVSRGEKSEEERERRKTAELSLIEKDDNPALSVVKALKVRDGSPLDVPIMLFGWDKQQDMHVSRGEKSEEERERRKTAELSLIAREVFRAHDRLAIDELLRLIMQTVEVKERTAKDYIRHMQESGLIELQKDNHYTLKK